MIDAHGGPLIDGQCAVTWGVMAPDDGGPGRLHVCHEQARPLVDGETAESAKHDRHDGLHRCMCGQRAFRNLTARIICEHPVNVGLCGMAVTGTELVDYRGPRRIGRDQVRAQTMLSVPCGHPTQRTGA